MKFSLVPQERRFYDLFAKQGALVHDTLVELSKSLLEGRSRHPRLRDLEHEADDVAHEIYRLVNQTFVTPIEREDILLLASSMDDVVDLAEEEADKIDLYQIQVISDAARKMGENLAKAGTAPPRARATSRASPSSSRTGSRSTGSRTRATYSPARRSARSSPRKRQPPTWSSGRTSTTCLKATMDGCEPWPTSWRRSRSRMRERILLIATIVVAVVFDFTNGFHDTANAIATSISTRAMTPPTRSGCPPLFNLIGAVVTVLFFHSKVSNTIASTLSFKAGMVVVIAALLGAITWNLVTWYLGLPSSSTHALIGGLVGAGSLRWGALGHQVGVIHRSSSRSLVISPLLGFVIAALLVTLIVLVRRIACARRPVNRTLRLFQIAAAAFSHSSHGGNDAQKTMAAITLGPRGQRQLTKFEVPVWVVVLSASRRSRSAPTRAAGGSSGPSGGGSTRWTPRAAWQPS